MIKMLWIALASAVLTGCVSTTQIIIKHHFPEEHINYEFHQGWTKEYQEKNMKLTYGSTVEMKNKEWTFTKIENTTSGGVVCVFSDSKGNAIKLTQQEVEQALSL